MGRLDQQSGQFYQQRYGLGDHGLDGVEWGGIEDNTPVNLGCSVYLYQCGLVSVLLYSIKRWRISRIF